METAIKFYVASSITNKDSVQQGFTILQAAGHEVETDWTVTDDVPESERSQRREYMTTLARRDFAGIRDCDIFVMLAEPAAGRSMYVELGVALAQYNMLRRPHVLLLGPNAGQSIFYYHPAVRSVANWDEVLQYCERSLPGTSS
jgi:hypothetical protein